MLKSSLVFIGTLFCICVFAKTVDLTTLSKERGKQYEKDRNILIGELKSKNNTINIEKLTSRQEKILGNILNARLKFSKLFEKLPAIIEKAKKNPKYGSEWSFNSRGADVLKWKLQKFIRQLPEQRKLVSHSNPTGKISDRVKKVKIQTAKEIEKAKETNRAARLAVVEYMLKFANEQRELQEILGTFRGNNPLVYPHVKKDILYAIEDVLKGTDNAKVMQSCISVFSINKFKNVAPLLREKLKKAVQENNKDKSMVLLNGLRSLGNEKDQELVKELTPKIEKMKVDKKTL